MENSISGMTSHINNDLGSFTIAPNDHLSRTPDTIKTLILSFWQENDSSFKEMSRTWKRFYQRKADQQSIRLQNLLSHVPFKIFQRQENNSHISRILQASLTTLVILEQDGVFCTSNRRKWRNISPEDSPDIPNIPVQTILQMGTITFAQEPNIYTIKLKDNTLVRQDQLFPLFGQSNTAVIETNNNNNERFYIKSFNIAYRSDVEIGKSLEDPDFKQVIKRSVLQGKWLSVILCEEYAVFRVHDPNTKLRVYDAQTKKLVFEKDGEFYHTKNLLIVNKLNNIFVFDMSNLSPEWQQNPIWVGTIENGVTSIGACNDRYLVLQIGYCSNFDEIIEAAKTTCNLPKAKTFVKYIMLDLIDGSQESYTKQVSGEPSLSSFLVQNFLFLYLEGKLDVVDLRLKKLIATNLEIPGFCLILDAKVLDKELLIYFTTSDHLHCMVQFTLENEWISLTNEEADTKEKEAQVTNTPVEEDPPSIAPVPVGSVVAAGDMPDVPPPLPPLVPPGPIAVAIDVPEAPPPPVAPIDNQVPNFLSSLWTMFTSCFSFIANLFARFFRE